jgi:copper chaperone CopZ
VSILKHGEKMISKNYRIEGMSCQHCVMALKKELSKLHLESTEIEIGSAKIVFDENKSSDELIKKAIEEAGYKVQNE